MTRTSIFRLSLTSEHELANESNLSIILKYNTSDSQNFNYESNYLNLTQYEYAAISTFHP